MIDNFATFFTNIDKWMKVLFLFKDMIEVVIKFFFKLSQISSIAKSGSTNLFILSNLIVYLDYLLPYIENESLELQFILCVLFIIHICVCFYIHHFQSGFEGE